MTRIQLRWNDDPRNTERLEATGGMPAVEAITMMELGPCSRCGQDPRDTGRGVIIDGTVHNGVLVGKVLCGDCIDDLPDPDSILPMEDLD